MNFYGLITAIFITALMLYAGLNFISGCEGWGGENCITFSDIG
jgi:hypothetical protein